ncbi:MAG: hypothetical protein HEP71_29285 [Roseivirga sp.]|nr:hypothetical protein [Roseivirga sp.]
MKKQILNIGNTLTKAQQKAIFGGLNPGLSTDKACDCQVAKASRHTWTGVCVNRGGCKCTSEDGGIPRIYSVASPDCL